MFEFIAGLVLGAAFSKFWIMVWNFLKDRIVSYMEKRKADKNEP